MDSQYIQKLDWENGKELVLVLIENGKLALSQLPIKLARKAREDLVLIFKDALGGFGKIVVKLAGSSRGKSRAIYGLSGTA